MMMHSTQLMPQSAEGSERLRADALAIWQAGVEAVCSDRLVQQVVRVERDLLTVGREDLTLTGIRHVVVVGCGKAGAGMATGLEAALGDELLDHWETTGWLNVPDDCVRDLRRIHLHGARPAGVNEPTEAGVQGAQRILELVAGLGPEDLCFCLISGGGSALLPAPVDGITLGDKLSLTRHLSGAGANIRQLNTVRKQLSRIKGGGLARACSAGRLLTLIISDVLGDPLDVIASGPTVADSSTPQDALDVLAQFGARQAGISDAVFAYLQRAAAAPPAGNPPPACHVNHLIIGNNATAVQAAGREAQRRGYETTCGAAAQPEGAAEDLGRELARTALAMRAAGGRRCFISGGEPTVRLVEASRRGLGGRNQQLVLAAVQELLQVGSESARGVALLSGGTDGEDGPTDAAGALVDEAAVRALRKLGLNAGDYLSRNDAYHFFQPLGTLLLTGPTHTNVCDLRVVLV
jgi:hydroxypyruvate reductase